ncbi:MAG TPA: DUF427 domain-containing protein [Acidimicrobiales bacterium]|nr:DUF427 domain-containing protein [Acidimicrobiales bacterium]
MTLTRGRGPFGPDPAGHFNFSRTGPAHVLFWDPSPKRVRAMFAGEAVADSRQAKLLHETGLAPVWYFPLDDVRTDLLVPTDRHTTCPFKGEASYWSIAVGDRTADNAAWGYPEPLESAPALAGHVAFYGDALDAWFEEDDQVIGHPPDPYHRIDVRQGSQHVRVRVGEVVVADSTRPRLLFETGLPPRYYLPEADLRADLLPASATTTVCPYKGVASYRSFGGSDGRSHNDVAWTYPDPLPDAVPVTGHWSFLGEGVETEVDGKPMPADA